MSKTTYAVALLVALALVGAGCGGSDSSSSGGAYGGKGGGGGKPASAEEAGGDGIVSAAKVGDLGTILVDSQGLTLYDRVVRCLLSRRWDTSTDRPSVLSAAG